MFEELVASEIICCPESKGPLESMEPWLYSSEDSDQLYPILSGTPILQPNIDTFLRQEVWNVCRVLAQWPTNPEDLNQWYFSRYASLATPDLPAQDTMVCGEGYPGFWEQVPHPAFADPLVAAPPEQRLCEMLGGRRFERGLDLGSGQGGMMQRMAQFCDQVLGLEQNLYLAALANQQLAASEIVIRYFDPAKGPRQTVMTKPSAPHALSLCGDVRNMPFTPESFDWIHCGHFLDLIDEPLEVLAQITALLKPGGCLTIATPWDFEKEDHFEGLDELLAGLYNPIDTQDGVPWLRFNHKRRLVLHEDWIWAGTKQSSLP